MEQHPPSDFNRLLYKLVRVGDDGSVIPTAEDEEVECFEVEREPEPPQTKHEDLSVSVQPVENEHDTGYSNYEKTISNEILLSTPNVQGKRKRKPNRRYIEDGTDNLYFTSDIHRLVPDSNDSFEGFKPQAEADSGSGVEYPEFDSPVHSIRHGRRGTLKRRTERKVGWSSRKRGPKSGSSKEKLIVSSPDKESYSNNLEGYTDQMLEEYGDTQSVGGEDCELEYSGDQIETVPTPNGGTRRKHHRPWTLREVMILIEGVARCGGGKWADIKKLEFSSVSYRTAVDLKDKWRNLLRASRVHFTSKQQTENKKKHFAVSIPQPILARVRELAALQNQQTSMPHILTRTSRSGRTLRRK